MQIKYVQAVVARGSNKRIAISLDIISAVHTGVILVEAAAARVDLVADLVEDNKFRPGA